MFYFPLIVTTWPEWMPFVGGEEFVFFSPVFNFADACVSVSVIALFLFCRKELATLTIGEEKPKADADGHNEADSSSSEADSTLSEATSHTPNA
jgi:signal peptidase II